MSILKNKYARRVLIILAALAIFLAGTVVASAGTLFDDVDDGAIYRDAVEWLVNRQVTLGCGGNNYCPDNRVTRAQMAMFMQRLGTALTPTVLFQSDGYTSLDLDTDPVVCQTAEYTTPDYPQKAVLDLNVSIEGAGTAGFYISPVVSADGGTTWEYPWVYGGFTGNFHRGSVYSGTWDQAAQVEYMELAHDTTLIFGIEVGRDTGTADASDYRCDYAVTIYNRNGTTSPLSQPSGSTDMKP
jgi:hypothetical protein